MPKLRYRIKDELYVEGTGAYIYAANKKSEFSNWKNNHFIQASLEYRFCYIIYLIDYPLRIGKMRVNGSEEGFNDGEEFFAPLGIYRVKLLQNMQRMGKSVGG